MRLTIVLPIYTNRCFVVLCFVFQATATYDRKKMWGRNKSIDLLRLLTEQKTHLT